MTADDMEDYPLPHDLHAPPNREPVRTFRRSPRIGKLAAALAKAQGAMQPATKDAINPHFKSTYADLASIIDAMRKPFADNGIAWLQFPRVLENEVEVETVFVLGTEDGEEWVSETLAIPLPKPDAHGIGMATTYAKRYSLQSMAGVPSEDDDGNTVAASVAKLRDQALAILEPAAKKGLENLETAWKSVSNDMRRVCASDLAQLKQKATNATLEKDHALAPA